MPNPEFILLAVHEGEQVATRITAATPEDAATEYGSRYPDHDHVVVIEWDSNVHSERPTLYDHKGEEIALNNF